MDCRIVELDVGALRDRGQADDAAAALAPVDDKGRLLRTLLEDLRRCGELGDDKLGIIDLGDCEDFIDLGGDGRQWPLAARLRDQLRAGATAAYFEPEREACNRTTRAVIDTTRLRLARAPGIGHDVDLRGGIEPEPAPGDREDQHQTRGDEDGPKRAPARRKRNISHTATL